MGCRGVEDSQRPRARGSSRLRLPRRHWESSDSLRGSRCGRVCLQSHVHLEGSVWSRFALFSDPSLCPSFRT